MRRRLDHKGRWRNVDVSFRVSPEEDVKIRTEARLAGLTRQEYIIQRVLNGEVIVQGNPKVYKALRDYLISLVDMLNRLEPGEGISEETAETILMVATIVGAMKEAPDDA